jgi:hypothetical protein
VSLTSFDFRFGEHAVFERDPAITWCGFGGQMFLRPACVVPLFVRLCRDLHGLDCPSYYARLRG